MSALHILFYCVCGDKKPRRTFHDEKNRTPKYVSMLYTVRMFHKIKLLL